MVKVMRISGKGDMAKIGEDLQSSRWYHLTVPVQRFLKNSSIEVGTEVKFDLNDEEDEKGVKTVSRINSVNGNVRSDKSTSKSSGFSTSSSRNNPEQRMDIRRAVALKAAVDSVQVLQGQVDQNQIPEVVQGYYETYLGLLAG